MLNADIPQARIPNLASRRQAIRLLLSGRSLKDSCLGNLISQEERLKGSNVVGSPASAYWSHPMKKLSQHALSMHSKFLLSVYTPSESWVNIQVYYIFEKSLQVEDRLRTYIFGEIISMYRIKKHQNKLFLEIREDTAFIKLLRTVYCNKITFGK